MGLPGSRAHWREGRGSLETVKGAARHEAVALCGFKECFVTCAFPCCGSWEESVGGMPTSPAWLHLGAISHST